MPEPLPDCRRLRNIAPIFTAPLPHRQYGSDAPAHYGSPHIITPLLRKNIVYTMPARSLQRDWPVATMRFEVGRPSAIADVFGGWLR